MCVCVCVPVINFYVCTGTTDPQDTGRAVDLACNYQEEVGFFSLLLSVCSSISHQSHHKYLSLVLQAVSGDSEDVRKVGGHCHLVGAVSSVC